MFIKQLYTACLSEAAYYIESDGAAAVIDPLRDIDEYLQLAKERNAQIKYIFETHFHADFVSGHLDLAKATGATIVYGPQTQTALPVYIAADGEKFNLGKLSVEVLHTPGHTLESSCFLLRNEAGKAHAIFSGDTLFVGDVGRPDLAQKGEELTMNDLAGMLYGSLQQKVITLPDDVILYPAHGAGSACGKNLGPATFSTIGEQKQSNYALKAESKEAFVKAVTEGLEEPPPYFAINAAINKKGYEPMDDIMKKALQPLSIAGVKEAAEVEAILIDTRPVTLFTQGFVPGSISLGLEGRFAEWAGSLLPFDKPLVLITEEGKEEESATRLARVGFTQFAGYLKGGYKAWQKSGEEIDMIIDVEADELAMDMPFDENLMVMDVRKATEFEKGHVQDAINVPLDEFTDVVNIANIEEEQNVYVHCGGGYRSVIAASLLKRQGIHNLRNVLGGWSAIKKEERIKTVNEEKNIGQRNKE